jgi:DNA-binding CsgD family transcriptional regulator
VNDVGVGLNNVQEPDSEALLGGIYDAALQPDRWGDALGRIGSQVSASSAFLFSSHSDIEPQAFMHVHNQPAEMLQAFGSHWYTEDAFALAAYRTGRMVRGTWVVGSELVPREQLIKTSYFNEFLKPHDIEALVGGVLFDGSEPDGMPFTNLCWYRPPGAPHFDAAEKNHLEKFVPHLQRALRIQRNVRSLADDRVAKALGALRVASLVLDRQGRVHHHNQLAAPLLESLPYGCIRSGQLRAIGERCSPSVTDALAACTASNPVRIVAVLPGTSPQVIGATLTQLPYEGASLLGAHEHERFLLLVELPRTDGRGAAAAVAELFGLSPAEVRVLGGLLEGATPAEISGASGTKMNTIRTQISNLLMKTNTKSQSELLLLMRGMRF